MPTTGTMQSIGAAVRRVAARLWLRTLIYDNQIVGLVVLVLASTTWVALTDRWQQLMPYMRHGFYLVPVANISVVLVSAIYMTASGIILIAASKPLARYDTVAPNLLALLGAFGVYGFSYLPATETPSLPVIIPLALLAVGGVTVLVALTVLRRRFSVTPQARKLVDTGIYSIVRHPMYIGNIVTLLGITLLIATVEGLLLFVTTAALQVCRALLEERLLERALPGYAAYKHRVGGFVPRLRARRVLALSSFTIVFLACVQVEPAGAQQIEMAQSQRESPMAARCKAWHSKALSGSWFTKAEAAVFNKDTDRTDIMERHKACRDFLELQSECEQLTFVDTEDAQAATNAIRKIEATPGCKSIAGFETFCEILKASKPPLSERHEATLKDCLNKQLLTQRAGLMRAGQ